MRYTRYTFITILFLIGILSSCDERPSSQKVEENQIKETFEQRMEREVTAALEIPATERYTFKVYKAFINNDTIEDAIITVNRKQYAEDQAILQKNTAKAEDLGYLGNYNFFFYYNGAIDKISVPIPVPSSAGSPLKIEFEPITQAVQNDVIISYRIRNGGFKTYFSAVSDQELIRVFNWIEFDGIGTDKQVATCHKYETSQDGLTKEIVLYEGEVKNKPNEQVGWHFDFEPELKCSGKKLARFFYNPRTMKYSVSKEDAEYLKSIMGAQ